jgi:hypothetical protein
VSKANKRCHKNVVPRLNFLVPADPGARRF